MKKLLCTLTFAVFAAALPAAEDGFTIWLTHSSNDADALTVNWICDYSGDSSVSFGTDKNNLREFKAESSGNLHRARVPIPKRDCSYFYKVNAGGKSSELCSFKGYPSKGGEFRAAVVGNLFGAGKLLEKVVQYSNPHVIFTCGDNVACLYAKDRPYAPGDIGAYRKMAEQGQGVLRSTIFMPILGNHDKEMTPRCKKRPPKENPVYDVEAKSYCKFFALPGETWVWQFALPDFGLRVFALDANHIQDMGTGWQSCREIGEDSEQFGWYRKSLSAAGEKFLVTLYNESNPAMRRTDKGIWEREFAKGSLCVSGFGYYMEFAKTESGTPYINTSLRAGDHYKDKKYAIYSEPVAGFTLLKVSPDGNMTASLLSLKDGSVLYSSDIKPRNP